MDLDGQLRGETLKWLKRIEKKRQEIDIDPSRQDMLRNVDAYISDCRHFLEKGMVIESFEAVVWAWSIVETLEKLEIIRPKQA